MQRQLPTAAQAAVVPEIDRLPGAKHQSGAIEGERQAGGGKGGADVGRHVIRALIVVGIRPPFAEAADRPHPLLGHEMEVQADVITQSTTVMALLLRKLRLIGGA